MNSPTAHSPLPGSVSPTRPPYPEDRPFQPLPQGAQRADSRETHDFPNAQQDEDPWGRPPAAYEDAISWREHLSNLVAPLGGVILLGGLVLLGWLRPSGLATGEATHPLIVRKGSAPQERDQGAQASGGRSTDTSKRSSYARQAHSKSDRPTEALTSGTTDSSNKTEALGATPQRSGEVPPTTLNVSRRPSQVNTRLNPAPFPQKQPRFDTTGPIYVHVSGAVRHPGVFALPAPCRAFEAVRAAGGLAADADTDHTNLASNLRDEALLYVPRRGESSSSELGPGSGSRRAGRASQASSPEVSKTGVKRSPGDGRPQIDLNLASSAELSLLPGVGRGLASSIVADRAARGPFLQIDDLRRVPRCGPRLIERITPYLKVETFPPPAGSDDLESLNKTSDPSKPKRSTEPDQ